MLTFRKATSADLPSICLLVKDAIAVMERNNIHQWDEIYPTEADYRGDINDGNLFVGEKDGEIAVVFAVNQNQDTAYQFGNWSCHSGNFRVIHRLCVNPKFQNQGIAKQTLHHIEQSLKNKGVESIRLDVFTLNPHAIRLYENAGYKKTGTAEWRKGVFWLMEKGIL